MTNNSRPLIWTHALPFAPRPAQSRRRQRNLAAGRRRKSLHAKIGELTLDERAGTWSATVTYRRAWISEWPEVACADATIGFHLDKNHIRTSWIFEWTAPYTGFDLNATWRRMVRWWRGRNS